MKLWPFNRAPQVGTTGSDGMTTASEPLVLTNSPDKREPIMDVERLEDAVRAEAAPAGEAPQTAAHAEQEMHESPLDAPRAPRRWSRVLGRFGAGAGERPSALPIRVLMGYLPEVSARDAKEYAQGMAEKHFEQMGLSYFDAFEFGNGYVFEAHEGGDGKAYAPEVIKYFESLGAYQVGEVNSVTIRTASRFLEVQRMREGLAAIMLPESAEATPTAWLRPTTSMTPGLNRRTAFLYAGVAVFATGVLSMLLAATVFRLQPYATAPVQKVESVSTADLPRSQWSRLESLPANSYVKALRYRNDKWESPEIVTDTLAVAPGGAPAPTAGPAPQVVPAVPPAPTAVPVPVANPAPIKKP